MRTMKTTTTKMKRRLALFVALIMALSLWTALPLQASADTPAQVVTGDNGIVYYIPAATGDAISAAQVINYEGDDDELEIPASITTTDSVPHPVTIIAYGAFAACELTSVTIPSTVTLICNSAFYDCTSLATVAFDPASGLTEIESKAFYNCTSLSSSITATTVAADAFSDDDSEILVGKTDDYRYSVLDGEATLWGYKEEISGSLVIPSFVGAGNYLVTEIGVGAFRVRSLLETVKLPSSITTIGMAAFDRSGLTSVTIPGSVTSIGLAAFQSCTSLKTVVIEEGVEAVGDAMFQSCSSLDSVTLPDSITSIGYSAFRLCSDLESITIPGNVASIKYNAFDGCALTSVWIPASVTQLGNWAFKDNPNLIEATIMNPVDMAPIQIDNNVFNGTSSDLKIWCYAGHTAIPDKYAVKAVIMIESIALDQSAFSLANDGTQQLNVTSVPASVAQYRTLEPVTATWESSNQDLVSVNSSGLVTAASSGFGTALITATFEAHSGATLTATCEVSIAPSGTPTTYPLTVNEGTAVGTGSFAEGATVTIIANDPPTGQVFAEWTGGGDAIDDPSNPITFFEMPGAPATVTATYKYAEPEASIDYTAEELKNLIAGDYTFNGTTGTVSGTTYTMNSNWIGTTLSIIRNENGDVADSDPQSLPIPARPDAPVGISKTNQTAAGQNDGTITGVTADMEWKGTSGNWQAVTGPKITGLAPGTYQVRTKATSSRFASAAVTLIIAAYVPPTPTTYAVTVMGGTGSASYEEGATVTITANASADGKVFDTWTTNDDVTFASASSSATSFVMPAKAVTVTATYKDAPVNPPVEPPTADNGWLYEDGVWKYLVDGEAETGWVYDQHKWYYTDAAGEMQTGWIHDGKAWYYLSGNGAMKTGWLKDKGSWYYLSGNGAMVWSKWLHDADGSWYYLSGNGKMLTGKQKIGSKTYSFKSNGVWIS